MDMVESASPFPLCLSKYTGLMGRKKNLSLKTKTIMPRKEKWR